MNTVDIILNLLKEQHKQQKELTQFLGIGEGAIADWKKGKTKSYKKHIDKIAEFFNVSTDYLLGTTPTIQAFDENDNVVVIDDETRDIIDSLRTNPEMKILFSVTKKATKEDIIKAVKIIEALKDDEG